MTRVLVGKFSSAFRDGLADLPPSLPEVEVAGIGASGYVLKGHPPT
jgi:hypothetical protein